MKRRGTPRPAGPPKIEFELHITYDGALSEEPPPAPHPDARVKEMLGMAGLLRPFLSDLGPDVERILPILEMILTAHGFATDELQWKLERLVEQAMTRRRASQGTRGKRQALGWVTALGSPAVAAREIIAAVIPRNIGCGAHALHTAATRLSEQEVEAARAARAARHADLELLRSVEGSTACLHFREGRFVGFAPMAVYLAYNEAIARGRVTASQLPRVDPSASLGHLLDTLVQPALARFGRDANG